MKRSDLRSRIASILDDEDLVFFEQAEINSSIDEACEVIAEHSRNIRRTAYCPIREGCNFYFLNSVATDIMCPVRIFNFSRNQTLTASSIQELDSYSRTWLDTSGNPDVWFPVSWDIFGVYPHAATGGGVLQIDYIAWPHAVLDDNDEPELPESAMQNIEFYSAAEGFLRQWDDASAESWWQLFEREFISTKDKTNVGRVKARDFERGHLNLPSDIRGGRIP